MTINNIGVTIINKALFANIRFPYPYMLTVIHMLINYLACHYIFYTIERQQQQQQRNNESSSHDKSNNNEKTKTNIWIQLLGDDLSPPASITKSSSSSSNDNGSNSKNDNTSMFIIMILYSMLFSMNIAIGNVSLQYVSINFNQVMRSLVPIIALYCTYLMNYGMQYQQQRQYQRSHHSDNPDGDGDYDDDDKPKNSPPIISFQRQMAVYMVVFGVIISTIGDRLSYTILGLIYTLLCVVLAALKVVVSSELLTTTRYPQFKMHPLRLLHRMAPLAFGQCLLMSILTGEWKVIRERWYIDLDPFTTGNIVPIVVLIISGVLAFSLNICALQAYKVTSPITCCITAAVKQVLMVWIGTAMFHTPITPLNGFGIVIVLLSSTYYSYISITEPKRINTGTLSHSNQSQNVNNNTITANQTASETIRHNANSTNHSNRNSVDDSNIHGTTVVMNDERHSYPDRQKEEDLHLRHLHTNNSNEDDSIELGVPLIRRPTSPPSSNNNGSIMTI